MIFMHALNVHLPQTLHELECAHVTQGRIGAAAPRIAHNAQSCWLTREAATPGAVKRKRSLLISICAASPSWWVGTVMAISDASSR